MLSKRKKGAVNNSDGAAIKALGETCGMTGWRVHAWVLMTNHCHVVIETPQANLVAG